MPEALRGSATEVMDLAAEATEGLVMSMTEGAAEAVSASIDPKSSRVGRYRGGEAE
jgi:hypothetical protein